MEVLIKHNTGPDESARAVAGWVSEHAGYYGAPHGTTKFRFPPAQGWEYAGAIPGWKALEILIRVFDVARGIENVHHQGVQVVDTESLIDDYVRTPERFGGWVTSTGNLTVVGGLWEYRDGHRHGLRKAQATRRGNGGRDTWWYIETWRSDVSPDDVGLEPSCAHR